MQRHVLVAGAAGGVGTTTVAALLAAAHVADGGSVTPVDHSGGTLTARLPAAWSSAGPADLVVHDRGPHAAAGPAMLPVLPSAGLLVVASSTRAAAALLPGLLARVAREAEDARFQLVLVQVHGRYRPRGADLATLHPSTTVLPRDDALAADGPIDWTLLSRRTRAAVADLQRVLTVRT